MLNTTSIKMGSNTSNVTLNTPSAGMMQRSHPKSFFVQFALGSKMESWIFDYETDQPYLYRGYADKWNKGTKVPVNVLQVMVFDTNVKYLVELVRVSDLSDEL